MLMKYIRKILRRIERFKLRKSIYTKDILNGRGFEIGYYTYGTPLVLEYGEGTRLKIGKFCSIAPGVKIFLGGNHRTDWISTYPFSAFHKDFPEARLLTGHPQSKGDVIIGNDVWLAHSVTILSGVSIGDGAVIAASSVISKNVGAYEIWGGNPAKFLRKRFSDDDIARLLNIKWWDWELDKIKKNINVIASKNIDVIKKL